MSWPVIAASILSTLLALLYGTVLIFSHLPRVPTPSEGKYKTNNGEGAVNDLPPRGSSRKSKADDSSLELTVVVPSYNETGRLGKMLEESVAYLEDHHKGDYEILIVDDGSKDHTDEFALLEATRLGLPPHVVKVVLLSKNRGKGGAVTHGILHGSGKYLLFADADGATRFSDMEKLLLFVKLEKGPVVAIGSRAHMVNTDAVVKRLLIRNFLMYGLHALVYTFGIRNIQDTQCGFKMFNQEAARMIFPHMHTERWIFDVEVLLLGGLQNITIREVPVNWQEIDGSKVDLARDLIQMAIDLVVTRMAYLMGIYKLDECGRKSG
ncbi:hypothetical protein PUMCH_000431 [Australozyma saopauloensis]|uniref:dolichyl-phosphate beta-glucosyltransferase n=1 Tax=Australozyma saopauloensis TaxID=291208 RepID=A0AAX4H3X0_9ASCO|nr:hypothetical protein PUMCH_000431 [[Candida] saopauloensis]